MSPVYKKEEAKKGGFAQVRATLVAFEGDVVKVEDGMWGGKLVDDEGKPVKARQYFEVETVNNVPLEVTEELSIDISEQFTFRVNMSEFEGSFWVDEFLASADRNKILLPDGLKGKRVAFRKVTKESTDPKYNVTNYIIDKVVKVASPAPKVVAKTVAKETVPVLAPQPEEVESGDEGDPMSIALEIAVGKTEAQFRSAIALNPKFMGSPLLPLAKAGAITQALVNEGRLVLVQEGTRQVYRKP